MNWSLGIDPSQKGYHGIAVIDENKEVIDTMKVASHSEAIDYIETYKYCAQEMGHDLLIGVEEIQSCLYDEMSKANLKFYSIMPLKIAAHKKTWDVSGMKTDLHDGLAVAFYTMEWHKIMSPYSPKEEVHREAWDIAKQFECLRESKTATWERFWSVANCWCPRLKELDFKAETIWFLLVVEDILPKCQTLGKKGFIAASRKRGSKAKDEVLAKILTCFKMLYRHDKARILTCLATQIRFQLEEIKYWEKQARPILAQWENGCILNTIKGMGLKTMTSLLAYVGKDWSQITAAQLSAYSGVAPVHVGSSTPPKDAKIRGHRNKERRTHRLACNKKLKTALCLFSWFSLQHHSWAKAKYDEYRGRNQTHWEAIRNLTIKWIRIFFKLMTDQVPFDSYRVQCDMDRNQHPNT